MGKVGRLRGGIELPVPTWRRERPVWGRWTWPALHMHPFQLLLEVWHAPLQQGEFPQYVPSLKQSEKDYDANIGVDRTEATSRPRAGPLRATWKRSTAIATYGTL